MKRRGFDALANAADAIEFIGAGYKHAGLSMKRVTLKQARGALAALAGRANAGQPTVLTQRGRPIAAIVPPKMLQAQQQQQPQRRTNFLSLRGSGKRLWEPTAAEFVARIRNEWK